MKSSCSRDAAAELDAHALDLTGMTDLEAHAEVLRALVDEQDREYFVVDDGADEVGHPVHEGVEVEGGVERVGEFVEEGDLEGFDSNLWVSGMLMEELRRRRAVVSLVRVLGLRLFGAGG